MTKKYCDKCKREMDVYKGKNGTPFYRTRGYDIDLCEDCLEEWKQFKNTTIEKYNKLHDDLDKQEWEEIAGFLGTNLEDIETRFGREMEL